jgi:C4-type Zn-finger protein
MTTIPTVCPACGGELELDRACVVERVVATPYMVDGVPARKTILARAVLCGRCEYCAEV